MSGGEATGAGGTEDGGRGSYTLDDDEEEEEPSLPMLPSLDERDDTDNAPALPATLADDADGAAYSDVAEAISRSMLLPFSSSVTRRRNSRWASPARSCHTD